MFISPYFYDFLGEDWEIVQKTIIEIFELFQTKVVGIWHEPPIVVFYRLKHNFMSRTAKMVIIKFSPLFWSVFAHNMTKNQTF